MRLTKLELHGFKSFADSTVMMFDQGVSAIVGPNGCGKSNVSDAVRWVLGEQRARLLRGQKMEEVIFQGSTARRPVNIAEVSLHFDNSDGELPVAFREVVVTRRLSRSGESEYLLNRAPCRLRDISDLLRGTGLGADTGVVIEAKMIDALLSDRPDDRRELFEEAAGIGLYRDRRRSTERRLEETTTDLQRLDDLIAEVQSQVRSLSRQRKRAERFSEITARRYDVEIALAAREMATWRDELARLEERVAELRTFVPGSEETVAEQERARDAAHDARAAADAQRAELSRLVAGQREHVQQLRSEMAVAEERQRNAMVRRQRAEAEATQGAHLREQLASDRSDASEERARFEQQLRDLNQGLSALQEREQTSRAAVTAARATLEQADRALREAQDALHGAELARERTQRELDETAERESVLEREKAALSDSAALARRDHEGAVAAREIAEAERAAVVELVERSRATEKGARDADAAARAALFNADEAHAALEGKVHALEALERERVGMAPAAARLLHDRARFGEGAILGPLSDYIATDQEAALLIERFLGATVHAVLVRDASVADAIREWHHKTSPGPLLLLPMDAIPASDDTVSDALAARIDAAPTARAWVSTLLGRVRALGSGEGFVDARGAVWLPGTAAGAGPLRRRAELFGLKAELTQAAAAREAAGAAAEAAREQLHRAEHDLAAASEQLAHSQRAVHDAVERQGQLERRVQRLDRELGEASALAARLRERSDALRRTLETQTGAHVSLAERVAEREAVSREARQRLVATDKEHDDARDARTQAQVSRAQVEARLQVATDRERRLDQEAETAASRLEELSAELNDLSQSDSTIAEAMTRWRLDLEAREAALADGEAHLLAAERAVKTADEELTSAEHLLDETRRRVTAMVQELHGAEVAFTELSGRRAAIRERLETEWRKPLEDMLAAAPEMDQDNESLRAEAESLRSQLEQLGPVNVLAIEEHDETVKRLEFLTGQRADLNDAKNSLSQAIREIDSTAREMFLTTFVKVREHFREIFMTLFGGGECDLRLENPEMPLDCDIEVHASPRGKKTQRIHLLSSGERALVALSLLFGIFLTKPSPFCVLDEVDAPLDDANIGRFVRMLNQFKQKTQFIVITHNPRTTTEAADAVYGVTMQEPGVSSVVSVRMKGAHVDQEIAAVA
ncbi:MAG TPA: chromosome segregation protein SMC [Gemmatimonadaceae bacterium]|nr:chromosome segregation protein SMC [Gemmatimonadaceae bacterium]